MRSNSDATWRKSSYSGGSGGDCLEVAADGGATVIPVRDSKRPEGATLRFQAAAWSVFVNDLKASPAHK
ncbi:DUF397 domain-containing protein [Streptomyces sp. SID5910]|uniref:DUF397 domain-containing protein n=1 Tax=Streptomyces sp. SID5910 TaxID=2690312 RepID=UPI001369DBD9|nr:DUF397 domain-containing protein [Streptomyces sp. SID5910]MYR46196.1 DUF397 domain-containing protein [Streptomyces sp. SID5910]MYR46515.1 DUF397 domain-containing protein [Streptomyces sp. SID5910]